VADGCQNALESHERVYAQVQGCCERPHCMTGGGAVLTTLVHNCRDKDSSTGEWSGKVNSDVDRV
jgi:hypothetical protein